MEAYSRDLRQRVIEACDAKSGTREQIAARFCVSVSWVYRLLQRRRQTGSIAVKPQRHGPAPTFDEAQLKRLDQEVRHDPDATLAQLRDRLGLTISLSRVHEALKKRKLSYKKRPGDPPSKTAPR